jgi:hypothetical protein
VPGWAVASAVVFEVRQNLEEALVGDVVSQVKIDAETTARY